MLLERAKYDYMVANNYTDPDNSNSLLESQRCAHLTVTDPLLIVIEMYF